ncbi:NiFe hydrogenase II subunit beta [Candidatus Omnitrophus magneticus]|uniref:NiFe hydrogenase II subunit beta n=1 Tax=Candidatus Omnitrophus magneticus TaxID=1609969 RepID=A0A0F0CUB4_9BACT|nr:NiFe hydrogenase II subunit beta [Candidatus Omnitrophus magneticus]
MKKAKVVAPRKKGKQFVFDEIDSPGDICLEYLPTILPPKKYFFPQKEKLGSFKAGDIKFSDTTIEIEPTIIFGAHTCDIDGIECLDMVFHKDPSDPYYSKREKANIIIGYECLKPCDGVATCVSMDTHLPKAGYDIMMTEDGDKYILNINSAEGDELIGKLDILEPLKEDVAKLRLKKIHEEKIKKFTVKLKYTYKELPEVFEKAHKSPVWKNVGERCVSCGNCTTVCPTCYCFNVLDEMELSMEKGVRERVWDSCQLEDFAKVAGGENFREEREERQKHRYYRKFDYPIKKYNKFFCTGCGRCTRACVAGISLIETVNGL